LQSFRCFRYLIGAVSDIEIVGVVPHQSQPPIRDDQDIRALARARAIPLLAPEDLADLRFDLGISLQFDRVLPAAVVERPRKGFVNVHLGPLPRFRGANSAMHAIRLARKDNHWNFGVTLHYLAPKVDTGPIIDVAECPIFEDDTAYTLHSRAADQVFGLFTRHIHRLVESTDRVPSRPQEGPSYFFRKAEVDHEVDLSLPPDEIYDRIRALTFPGKPRAYAVIGGRRIYLSLEET
jgi:methionyl-tRNA formyltransferase